MPGTIVFKNKGDFSKTFKWMHNHMTRSWVKVLQRYGEMGVQALAEATPKDTGETAASWYYEIVNEPQYGRVSIVWNNSHVEKGWANIAILLQYGHGTRNGGYVQGRDYINPALAPVFDEMANAVWEEVKRD